MTQTLKLLASQGVLVRIETDGVEKLRRAITPSLDDLDSWIDRQVHGDQIKETPEEDRPRERLLRDGAPRLSTGDLLAILIRVGVRGESAVQAGRKVANRFGDRIDQLVDASLRDLRNITPAVNRASFAQIMAGIELGRRIADLKPESRAATRITSCEEAIRYCQRAFVRLAQDAVQEEFHIVTLDTKHQPIGSHCITVGTLDASLVHPREVFRAAIRDAASSILLVHNHPSGDPTPSPEDREVTRRLIEVGKVVGIRVLDHIVLGRSDAVSLLMTHPSLQNV